MTKSTQGSIASWRQRINTLKRNDWDRRVRISAGDRDGARVGSVAQVPPVGVKLALREAMIDRAEAEIAHLETRERLREIEMRRMAFNWGAFAGGGVLVAIIAALARAYFG